MGSRKNHAVGLATADERQARICIGLVAQYLRCTLHFALFYEPVHKASWDCYTDASWSAEVDYSHQAAVLYYETNLIA